MENYEGVKFYSASDMSVGYNLKKCDHILRSFEQFIPRKINDILELYNVIKHLDLELYLVSWTQQDVADFKIKTRKIREIIGRFFSQVSESNMFEYYSETHTMYKRDFWELFEYYKCFIRVSSIVLLQVLNKFKMVIFEVLEHQKITNYYGVALREFLLENPVTAEILISKFGMTNDDHSKQIFLPEELTNLDKDTILNNYIKCDYANLNYLRTIATMKNPSDWIISDRIRLDAKNRSKDEEIRLFSGSKGLEFGVQVAFSPSQQQEEISLYRNNTIDCTYSLTWIIENQDFNTLLNNFIHLFHFSDLQMRIQFVNRKSYLGIFEKLILNQQKDIFPIGISFQLNDWLSYCQLRIYNDELCKIGITLEEIIKWFFSNYLPDELDVENFKFQLPSKDATYFEKCRSILPEIDSIIKQYKLYVEYGEIERELLEFSSLPLTFDEIPSLQRLKYAYGSGQEFERLIYLFFSDQCMLSYLDRLRDGDQKYANFFELIINEKIFLSDYINREEHQIKWLLENNYITTEAEGLLEISDPIMISVLKDLNDNEVINFWRCPKEYRDKILELNEKGVIIFEDKLLSRLERDYLNFYLNRKKFCNSFDLRNRYLHGTQPDATSDEMHKNNYYIILKIIIILVIKINDDLCLLVDT